MVSLSIFYAPGRKSVSSLYARRPSSISRHNLEASAMYDVAYLLLGLAIFAVMGLYARWAGNG